MKKNSMHFVSCSEEAFTLSDDGLLSKSFSQQTPPSHLDSLSPPMTVLRLHPSPSSADEDGGRQPVPLSLKQRTRRRSPHFMALIDLMINEENVRLNLESVSLPCAYKVEVPLTAPGGSARHYNNLTELRFSLQVRHSTVKARNLFLSLRLPWGTTHYLGPLAQKSGVFSARFVKDVPPSFTIVVDVDRCIPAELNSPLPCEMLLKEHVKTILENDDFCGSIAAAHVQNLVRDLPFYPAAMRRFRTWSEYVTLFGAFYHCWETVQYEEEEHAALGLSSLTPPGELRLVAHCFAHRYPASDAHRDQIKWRALCDFRELILDGGGEVCSAVNARRKGEPALRLSRSLLRSLGCHGSFRTLNSVNYLHVLENLLSTSRVVLFCERHPVQVDLSMTPDTTGEFLLAVGSP